ncbi:zeta toxin family protein [Tomitella biformata]|uniref:zeta toxin family protein n=1 Tax=Tomitella biformata TaxID=630403 RepID=UPI001F1DEB7C|nr:zeta toxin family protein [Tomitella biformata]
MTAAVLERMCGRGGVLNQNGAAASHRLHADNARRRRTLDRIIESYLAEQDNVVIGGQFCAIATAGVPCAGKSTSIERHGLAGQGWRVLDASVYRDIMSMGLPDGGTVMPRELATLVHMESTKIVDALQELCMGRGENLVIEGTFSWLGLGERLTIMDVEVARERAQEQALQRWWTGRTDGDEFGGRFTPTSVIASLYPTGSVESICASNARAAFEHPLAAEIDAVELWVDDYTSGVLVEKVSTRHKGVISYEPDVASPEP